MSGENQCPPLTIKHIQQNNPTSIFIHKQHTQQPDSVHVIGGECTAVTLFTFDLTKLSSEQTTALDGNLPRAGEHNYPQGPCPKICNFNFIPMAYVKTYGLNELINQWNLQSVSIKKRRMCSQLRFHLTHAQSTVTMIEMSN